MAARSALLGLSRLVSTRLSSVPVPIRAVAAATRKNLHVSAAARCEAELEAADAKTAAPRDPSKFRDQIIPVETSISYLESEAYQISYGENPVWQEYRRNYKGHYQPRETRKTCIRQQVVTTGNPCPICRDEYLVLDYRNIKLLQQFICPHTGAILSYTKTGLCKKRHQELLVAVEKARDYGYLTFDVPHRVYDYSEYIAKN